MKRIYFLLTFILFLTHQIWAVTCEVQCLNQEVSTKEERTASDRKPMALDHSCCKGSSSKSDQGENEEHSSNSCLDDGAVLGCFHDQLFKDQAELVKIDSLPLLNIAFLYNSDRLSPKVYKDFPPKIPEYSHIRENIKSQLRLHILKDQFLI